MDIFEDGSQLTLDYITRTFFSRPILVKNPKGLGMKIPDSSFDVGKILQLLDEMRSYLYY